MRALKVVSILILLIGGSVLPASPANSQEIIFGWLPCSIANESPCIKSISYINGNGVRTEGKLSGRSRVMTRNIALKNYKFTDYEWSLPGLKQSNGTDRMLLTAYYFPKNFPYCWLPDQDLKTCDYGVDQLIFDISPSWWDSQPPPTHFENSDRDDLCGTKEFPSVCIGPWSMNGEVSYEIVAKMPKNFDARMLVGEGTSGELNFSTDKNGDRTFTLLAKPALRSFAWNVPQRPINFKDLDKADVSGYFLNFAIHSSAATEPQWFSKCDTGEGFSIWSDSLERSSPYWIADESTLAMNVSGLHRRMDGSLNVGTFQIQIPIKVAQCMWGVDLSKAVSASISAVYKESNVSEIVTTTSKIMNGFYYLSANGFHYSAPTIKVKLSQVSGTVNPTPKPLAGSSTIKSKTSITCVKGTQKRKVTAYTPKCPAGFKKIA